MFSKYQTQMQHYSRPEPEAGQTSFSPPDSPRTVPIEESQDAKEIMTLTEPLEAETVMKIGKYRGRTFGYISKDKFYTRWVRQQQYPRGPLGLLKQWLDKNARWLEERNMAEALAARGPLSKRVRIWDVEQMRTKGILRALPNLANAVFGRSRRPRPPTYCLQAAGVIPGWEANMGKREKWQLRCRTALVGRFLSYVFRRVLHQERGEPVEEPLIADRAMLVLGRNDYAYRLALKLTATDANPNGDPETEVNLELLEQRLQEKRAAMLAEGKSMEQLPESLRPCFSRLGCAGQGVFFENKRGEDADKLTTTPRRILLRFMLSLNELQSALRVYRNMEMGWDSPACLQACWVLARADGAFDYDRISNEEMPLPLQSPSLGIYGHMQRLVRRHFGDPSLQLTYGPCVGFSATGCPLEADLRVGDTVYAVRGGMWISTSYDTAYLQGYAAIARSNGIGLNRCVVFYLQHASSIDCELEDWDHQPLLEFLQNNASEKDEALAGTACDLGLCEPPPDHTIEEGKREVRQVKKQERQQQSLGRQAMA